MEVKGKRLARASPRGPAYVKAPDLPVRRPAEPAAYALSFIGAASANRSVSPRTTSAVMV